MIALINNHEGGLRKSMCKNQNELPKSETDEKKSTRKKKEVTINELLNAISDTEYPQYILEAAETVKEWMNDMIRKREEPDEDMDIFAALFGEGFEDERGLGELFERLNALKDFADVIPTSTGTKGKPDTIIISLMPSDYESGLRSAIDYAAVFNKQNCQRVWIISDTFILDEVMKFAPHVDALAEKGITLRFLLVTPWGWVELPLSGSTVSKNQFVWKSITKTTKTKRKQQ